MLYRLRNKAAYPWNPIKDVSWQNLWSATRLFFIAQIGMK
jgi:hypothetical protein